VFVPYLDEIRCNGATNETLNAEWGDVCHSPLKVVNVMPESRTSNTSRWYDFHTKGGDDPLVFDQVSHLKSNRSAMPCSKALVFRESSR